MAIEAQRLPFERLASAAEAIAAGADRAASLELLARAAAAATGAELAAVRVLDRADGTLVARAVAPPGSPRAAEAAGSRLPPAFASGPERLLVPARAGGRLVGAVELAGSLDATARPLAELAAAQLALVLRDPGPNAPGAGPEALERVGAALAAGAELEAAARRVVREAVGATGAGRGALWQVESDGLELLVAEGRWEQGALAEARTLAAAAAARASGEPVLVERHPAGGVTVWLRFGAPPFALLALRLAAAPAPEALRSLARFGARAAHALRLGIRAQETARELARTRALLAAVGEAISPLTLAHALETAVDRVGALLALDRVGVYLREGDRLVPAATRGLGGRHEPLAAALLELAAGPLRARETIVVGRGAREGAVAAAGRALAAAGVEAALAAPLRAGGETIGLLVACLGEREPPASDRSLLAALAAELAVAVQNARLHEEATRLGDALASALASERRAARRLRGLYEIANAFTRSLSLERTLEAIAETTVAVLGVDAAVVSVPAERGEALVPGSVRVADERLAPAVRAILDRPQPHVHLTQPLVLDERSAGRLGGGYALLVPFLAKGSTAAVVPIATKVELVAHLTVVSLDPARPIAAETVETATAIAAQAALAIDNARLYQQQKAFAETIQRALLPAARPQVDGLDVGATYVAAARLDVGGDVYDFAELGDGRLAIVLGDVTGHGVEATADMAMATFVFRSLVREHPEPAAFLAHANEVVAGEVEPGKFITMACVAVEAGGRLACASAGHPVPRLVRAGGTVAPLGRGGLPLGIERGQTYAQAEATLGPGDAVVLYTDGVTEARSGSEQYGVERLDACLRDRVGLPAQALAAAVLADCRAFAGGELRDDAAAVVVRRA